jgi:FAD/FMN-containing dehydrogenase
MGRILDVDPVRRVARVQPGVTVGALNAHVAELGLRFAPDPTSEHDATIGGAIACNASGARSLRYGATRPHVRALRVALADGSIVDLRRTRVRSSRRHGRLLRVSGSCRLDRGQRRNARRIVEAELALVRLPEHELGLAIPFPTEGSALAFIASARERGDAQIGPRAQCLEFFDEQALAIARDAVATPGWMTSGAALVYLEQAADGQESADAMLEQWLAFAEPFGVDAGEIEVYADSAAPAPRGGFATPCRRI